jgi:hypothetical protein
VGASLSGATHADKSKNMDSSALACAVSGSVLQPFGNGTVGLV